jgi:hypothetical protein
MITDVGKGIIAKYLVGNAPAYASYIALGCGARPRNNVTSLTGVSSSGTTITTASTLGLWVGAQVVLLSGSGALATSGNTIVTSIVNGTSFLVNLAPTTALSGAVLSIQPDSSKRVLDFEMFRAPITSRGYINDNGVNKIVFTAQLPAEERYEISEIATFSAGSNGVAGIYDSKLLYSFAEGELWEYHTSLSSIAIPQVNLPLDGADDDVISVVSPVFQASASNRTFTSAVRLARYERPRFFNNTIFMAGNDAAIYDYAPISGVTGNGTTATYTTSIPHGFATGDTVTITGISPSGYNVTSTAITVTNTTTFTLANATSTTYTSGGQAVKTNEAQELLISPSSNHIHLNRKGYDLTRNSPADLLKLAFSVVNKDGADIEQPDSVRIVVDFSTIDTLGEGEFARFQINIDNGSGIGQYDLQSNRFIIATTELQGLFRSAGFNWNAVQVVKVYASVIKNGVPSADYYVALDALRLDNIQTQNVLYGMTGYSIVQNGDATSIIKAANTSNFVEFRFIVDVT